MTQDHEDDERGMMPAFPMEVVPVRGHNAEIDASREMAEVQAQAIMAMKNPRVRSACNADIIEDCKRYTFAKEALFSYPRGGQTITDGSIKLALVMAQNWMHLDIGVRELERRDGESIVESYCWDLQKNFRQRRRFAVPHSMIAGGKLKVLSDPRDIYEHLANMGARRLRACIFDVIPSDVKKAAVAQVRRTLALGPTNQKGEPIHSLAERVANMVSSFRQFGVDVEMIEKRLGHKVDLTTTEELVEFQAIWNSIKDGSKRSEFFEFEGGVETAVGKAAELAQRLHGGEGR